MTEILSLRSVLGKGTTPVSLTGTLTETVLGTIHVPGGRMGTNGLILIEHGWAYTNSANQKTLRLRAGGLAGSIFRFFQPTTSVNFRDCTSFFNDGATNSQEAWQIGSSPFGSTTGAFFTSAIDTTADFDIAITGQLANTGETLTLKYFLAELVR
jgi:hypothetical protein